MSGLWLSTTDPSCPILGWGFLSKGLAEGEDCSWDSASPASSFLLPTPSCQPPPSSLTLLLRLNAEGTSLVVQ